MVRLSFSSYHVAEQKKLLHCGACFQIGFLLTTVVLIILGIFFIVHPFTSFYLYSPYQYESTNCTIISKQDGNAPKYFSLYLNVTYDTHDKKQINSMIQTCLFRDKQNPDQAKQSRDSCSAPYAVGTSFSCMYKKDELEIVRTISDVINDSTSYRASIIATGSIFLVVALCIAPVLLGALVMWSFTRQYKHYSITPFLKEIFRDAFLPGIVVETPAFELVDRSNYVLLWGDRVRHAVGNPDHLFAPFMDLLRVTSRVQEEYVQWEYKPSLWRAIAAQWVVFLLTLAFFAVNMLTLVSLLTILFLEDTVLIYDFIYLAPVSLFAFVAFLVMARKCIMGLSSHYMITSDRIIKCRKYWFQHTVLHYIFFDEIEDVIVEKRSKERGDIFVKSNIHKDLVLMFKDIDHVNDVAELLKSVLQDDHPAQQYTQY